MGKEQKDIKAIFSEAIEKQTPEERAAYLDEVCGNDAKLRSKIDTLLKAHEQAGSFMNISDREPDVTLVAPSIEGAGTKIGRYELLELIGEGGMGLVYLAEQKEPVKRKVALKIVKLGMDTKQVVARFEAERQTLALLEHPNIAHVFDAGTTEAGRPYFVMEYVEGKSITKYCDEEKLSVEQRLQLFQVVCETVHHAHQKGIIHRDIKPSNILVSVQDGKPVPKIIDFGIAKAVTQPLTGKTSYTQQGQLLGTPEYMSPEQAEMAYEQVDTRSDIYSLGVVLYELLAGVTPYDAEKLRKGGIDHIQQIICEEQPRTPSARLTSLSDKAKAVAQSRRTQIITLIRRLHRELEWIPMKAMRKDRNRRYRSASELADDIHNYITGAPLIAGPESTVYRARKFVRKHAGSVVTAALLLVVIILGLVASILMGCRAEQARKKEAAARKQVEQALARAENAERTAQEQHKIAEERADKYRHMSYIHGVALADVKYREGNLRSARKLLESCPEDKRNWEWYRLNHVMDEALVTFNCPPAIVSMALSPDGKRIASTNVDRSRDDWQHRIMVWDAVSGAKTLTLKGYEEKVFLRVEFSPDGKRIVSGGIDKTVRIWDASSGEEIMRLEGHEKPVGSVLFSPDGKRIISGSHDGTVKVWDTGNGRELMAIQIGGFIRSVAVSPDGERIIVGNFSSKITEWDAATGEEVRTFSLPDQEVSIVKYSPDGKRIALGCKEGMIKILDAATGEGTIATAGRPGLYNSMIMSLAFSPDSKRIVSGSMDHTVRIWDAATGDELTALVGHGWKISSVAFSPDGERIVSASNNGKIKIWNADTDTDKEGTILEGHEAPVRDIVFSPDGKQLVSASYDKTIKLWDVSEVNETRTLRGHEGPIWGVAISHNGKCIASGSSDKTVRIWDASTGDELMTLGQNGNVLEVAFSPDGKRIASAGEDVRIWDAKTGEEVMILPKGGSAIAFSPDGKWIVSGNIEHGIKIWDVATGEELKTLSKHQNVSSVLFSPDGKRVVSAGYGGHMIRIWDVAMGDELMILHGHKTNIEALAISTDGKRIVSGSFTVAKVWDAATGAELMTLPSNGSYGVAFSPDGKTIAIGSGDGNVILCESGPRPAVGGSNQSSESTQKVVD